jgi:hypothetical protein
VDQRGFEPLTSPVRGVRRTIYSASHCCPRDTFSLLDGPFRVVFRCPLYSLITRGNGDQMGTAGAPEPGPLVRIREMVPLRAAIEAEITGSVRDARGRELLWAQIAYALGVPRSSAYQVYVKRLTTDGPGTGDRI